MAFVSIYVKAPLCVIYIENKAQNPTLSAIFSVLQLIYCFAWGNQQVVTKSWTLTVMLELK